MKKNYDFCITEVLKSEGGYTNDPSDSGGATNYGITIADYKKYINKNGTPDDVRNMTVDQAKIIYKNRYWNALACDDLPSGVDYTVFDYGVNSGISRANKVYNQLKNTDTTITINAINDERLHFLQNLAISRPKDQKFLKGWTSRVSRVRSDSLRLAKSIGGIAGAGAGGAIIAGGTAMAATPHNYWPWIIGGIAVVGVIAGISYLIHKYKKA
jgi:lysozyme family protein